MIDGTFTFERICTVPYIEAPIQTEISFVRDSIRALKSTDVSVKYRQACIDDMGEFLANLLRMDENLQTSEPITIGK